MMVRKISPNYRIFLEKISVSVLETLTISHMLFSGELTSADYHLVCTTQTAELLFKYFYWEVKNSFGTDITNCAKQGFLEFSHVCIHNKITVRTNIAG